MLRVSPRSRFARFASPRGRQRTLLSNARSIHVAEPAIESRMLSCGHSAMSSPLDSELLRVAMSGDATRVACEHADRCGGCPIIALPYGEQLSLKRGRVVQSIARYPALELVYTEPVAPADPIVSYRTRAKLIVGPGAKVGLFAK